MSLPHPAARRAALLVPLVAGIVMLAQPAWAHVTLNPSAVPGGDLATVAFQVPNEKEVPTVKVEVFLPTDHPLPVVVPQAIAGWTITMETAKLPKPVVVDGDTITEAVSSVTWTGTLPVGQFAALPVRLGPLPKSGQVTFKTLQTYSDGSVVRWIEVQQPGQPEPENPAPVLDVTAGSKPPESPTPSTPAETTSAAAISSATSEAATTSAAATSPAGTSAAAGTSAPAGTSGAATTAPAASAGASPTAADSTGGGSGSGAGVWLGLAGLVVGTAGVVIGVVAYRRTRSAPTGDRPGAG